MLIFSRKLEKGNGDTFYGLLVGKYIIKNNEFMQLAYEIKNEIVKEDNEIVTTKKSHFNSSIYLDHCAICKKRNTNVKYEGKLDVHHIGFQSNCDCHDFVIGTHQKKNDSSNLVVLCKSCHYAVHKPNPTLIIKGYLENSTGRSLDFDLI